MARKKKVTEPDSEKETEKKEKPKRNSIAKIRKQAETVNENGLILASVEELRAAVDAFELVQKSRIQISNRIEALRRSGFDPTRVDYLHSHMDDWLRLAEHDADQSVIQYIGTMPLWSTWAQYIKGIGEHTLGFLVSAIKSPTRHATVSKLWANAGLIPKYYECICTHKNAQGKSAPHKIMMSHDPRTRNEKCMVIAKLGENEEFIAVEKRKPCDCDWSEVKLIEHKMPKRTKGWHFMFDARLRKAIWKAVQSLIRANGVYKKFIYDVVKAREIADAPELHIEKPWVIEVRARRKLAKIFMSHVWSKWRETVGLPEIKVYSVVFKGEEEIKPLMDPVGK